MAQQSTTKKKATRKKKPTRRAKVVVGPESDDPRFKGLVKWKPGQSGNPGGSSRKQRRQRFLKQVLNDAINMKVPEGWRGKLAELQLANPGLSIDVDDGDLTIAEVLGAQIVVAALRGDDTSIAHILGTEPKQLQVRVDENDVPMLDGSDERMDEVAEILRGAGVLH